MAKNQPFKLLLLSLIACLSIGIPLLTSQAASNSQNLPITDQQVQAQAKGAIAIDANSGQILYGKNINQRLPAASVSKLVTIGIVLQKIKQHQLSWNTKVPISQPIATLSQNPLYTNVPLRTGQTYTVRQLYNASLVTSANAAAMALGRYIAGSNGDFGQIMRQTVSKWGVKNAQLYNACGLTNQELGSLGNSQLSGATENKLSAQETALIAQKVYQLDPKIVQTTALQQINWNGIPEAATNHLLGSHAGFQVDGLKTGTSDTAGENLVSTATKGNHRVITVVIGAATGQRNLQTVKILNGLNQLQVVNLQRKNLPYQKLPVINGKQASVPLGFQRSPYYWLRNSDQLKTKLVPNDGLNQFSMPLAPIHKHQPFGQLKVQAPHLQFIQRQSSSIPVIFTNSDNIAWGRMFLGCFELIVIIAGLGYLVYWLQNRYAPRH
ncbi:D-alanyl-D-alanine carboxypeptidase [Fructilactobacillus cliffordii]|uniref:D-alanyl-D-alanine carboxypeptidase family protein n=1 Tax=Fructilactobacillus cliffordii TaxID=2940299 RepID=UPI0020920783|nr:D-alanyl-D-alanine carboxypeptidase family protein [Fructilactobacillus cliffordii]USS87122.1 D-alanyl-D-alanine carboxypeptidase [Fructilactobacillus cliffordii]